jgi:hypothetical protein
MVANPSYSGRKGLNASKAKARDLIWKKTKQKSLKADVMGHGSSDIALT